MAATAGALPVPAGAPPLITETKTLDIARPTLIKQRRKKAAVKIREPVYERRYKGANIQIRPGLAETYEAQKSGREKWWREYIRETPLPHSYEVPTADTFIKDLQQSINTYSFKSHGRKLDAHCGGKGAMLMPGAYEVLDMSELMPEMTYNFKGKGRKGGDILNEGVKDKDINVAPNQYNIEKYDCVTVVDPKNKHGIFKSATKRFPTIYFTPKTGPSPGQYNPRPASYAGSVSSSFKSATPRFKTSHTRVPGPGMYEPTFQSPQTKTLEKMGRLHGLFFSCSFQK